MACPLFLWLLLFGLLVLFWSFGLGSRFFGPLTLLVFWFCLFLLWFFSCFFLEHSFLFGGWLFGGVAGGVALLKRSLFIWGSSHAKVTQRENAFRNRGVRATFRETVSSQSPECPHRTEYMVAVAWPSYHFPRVIFASWRNLLQSEIVMPRSLNINQRISESRLSERWGFFVASIGQSQVLT